MANHKKRSIEELYKLTGKLSEPKITPILKGAHHMQGPVDDLDHNIEISKEAASFHKILVEESSQHSFDSADAGSILKRRTLDDQRNVSSVTSDLASSSRGSFSENAESKTTMRISDTSYSSMLDNGVKDLVDERVFECHGDNISCITLGKHTNTKGLDSMNASCCSHDSDPSEFPSSNEGNTSPKTEVPSSHSRSTYSVKDMEENSSFRHRAEPSIASTEHVNSSLLGAVTTNGIDGKKSAALDSGDILQCPEDTKARLTRSNSSAWAVMKVHPCLETENSVDLPPSVVDKQEPTLTSQQTSESEHSGSDILEDDVKVCDICGDAGREDLLAICSRCNDGAEHIYCMQAMLHKVPDGDWLCEECKLKEDAETQNSYASETMLPTPKLSLNEKIENSKGTVDLKDLSKLDTKVLGIERNKSFKAITNLQVPAKRPSENPEVASTTEKQVLELATGLQGMISPGKKPALSRETSLKNMDTGKVKPTHSVPLVGSQETGKLLTTFGPNSSTMQTKLQSPCSSKLAVPSSLPSNSKSGSASPSGSSNFASKAPILSKVPVSPVWPKSNAFPNLKPRVKKVLENAPQKQKVVRESTNGDISKEGSVRKLSKPMFSSVSSSCFRSNSGESKPKLRTQNISRSEDSKSLKQAKERLHLVERNNSFKMQNSNLSPSEGSKGFEIVIASAGSSGMKKQRLFHSADLDNGTVAYPNKLLPDGLSPSHESTKRDGRSRESFMPGGRSIRCYKCQEIGHIAQYCNHNLGVSTVTASAGTREVAGKSKWKRAVEVAMSKKARIRLLDRSDELSMSNSDTICEAVSNERLSNSIGAAVDINARANPSSTCIKKLPSIEGTFVAQGSLSNSVADYARTSRVVGMKQHAFAIPTRTSIPEHHYLWKGGFEVQRSGGLPEFFDGIQAHLSTSASPKVLEITNKFPFKLQLQEVPHLSSWPKQFQGNCVTEDNVALYFFAKDLESYERNYKKLMENMLKNDSALKGVFDGIELLIFPSNRLPEKSHRWNRLFFLWGVFRGRKDGCSDQSSASFKKLSVESLYADSSISNTCIMDEISISQKMSSNMHMERELSKCDRPLGPLETAKPNVPVDLPSASSPGRDCCAKVSTVDKKSSAFCNLDHSAADDTLSSEKYSLCSVPETHPDTSVPLLANLNDTGSSSRVPTSNTPMCSEVKSNRICRKEVYRDKESRKDIEVQTHVLETKFLRSPDKVEPSNVQSSPDNVELASVIIDASSCRQAGFLSSLLDKRVASRSNESRERSKDMEPEQKPEILKEKERFKDNATSLGMDMQSGGPTKKECSGWESRSNKKPPHSHSSETPPEASGETSKETHQTITWKGKSDCLLMDQDYDPKKLKRSQSELHNFYDGLPSPIHDRMFLNPQGECAYDEIVIPENSRTSERCFFPVDSGCVRDCKSGNSNPWPTFLTNDEGSPESDAPNLELALGTEKRSSGKGILPLFAQLGTREKLPDHMAIDDTNSDLSSSLSLSLAFPFPEKDTVKPVSRTEQILPDRHRVNTSLLLFGGFTDT